MNIFKIAISSFAF